MDFDRAASAMNALPGMLFNSLWHQRGTSGIDLFKQRDWPPHINFVHLPFGQLPRFFAFMPTTRARVVVLAPMVYVRQWTPLTLSGAPGLLHRVVYAPGASPLLAHRCKNPTETFRGRYVILFYDFTPPASGTDVFHYEPPPPTR